METLSLPEINMLDRQSERKGNQFRQAAARRKLQELRDEEALRNWLTEVWDENPLLVNVNSGSHFH
jgi:Asp-tRNA(Asn)/Glu-tRNA(Gln) amidotransferase B subunit